MSTVVATSRNRLGVFAVLAMIVACGGSSGSDYLDGATGDASSSGSDSNNDSQGDDASGGDSAGSDSQGAESGSSGGCNPSSCKPCVLGQASCTTAGACQCCVGTTCLPD
jgi:hypothetical protein